MFKTLLISLSFVLAVSGLAMSQEKPPEETKPTDATAVEAMVQKVTILTRAPALTAVPENEPLPINLSMVSVPGVSPALTQGVTAKAYTRYVTVEGQQIGQVVLTAIEKDGRTEPLSSNNFTAQFNMEKPELEPTKPIEIQGNQQELLSALQRLSEPVAEGEEPQERKEAAETDTGANRVGSNAKENQDAATYKNPEPLAVAEAEAPIIKITTEGCDIRVDKDQGYAFQQARVETTENGTVSTTECSDGEVKFKLQRSYSSCGDLVVLEDKTATSQYIEFYTDAGGTRQEVSECTADAEQVFAITEKRDACTVYLDYAKMEAVTQAALVYTNSANTEVQVRGCEPSTEVAAVTLEETKDGCSIRHDVSGGKSIQQVRNIYTLSGVTWQAGGCTDSDTEYAHTKVYESSGGSKVCTPVVNLGNNTATLQYRLAITVDSVEQYIGECTPDTSTLAITATTDGCTTPSTWTHDLSAGVSYGKERHYYLYNGNREYVNSCQDSAATYAHQVETTGWQDHDDQLFAYPLSTVYINAPTGRYDIKVSEVLSGAAQQPYVFEEETTASSGEIWYEDCSKFEGRNTVENYTRPSGSQYPKVIAPTTPAGPTNICLETGGEAPSDWVVTYESGSSVSSYWGGTCNEYQTLGGKTANRSCTFEATRQVVNSETNEVVSTVTKSENSTRTTSTGFMCGGWTQAPPVAPSCAPATATEVATWRAKYGW